MSTGVIVFAKAPLAGFAKTRLAPALGAQGAAALADRMLRHTLAQAVRAGIGPVELCAAPDTALPVIEAAAAFGVMRTAQGGGELGERMHRAFVRALSRHRCALLIGTDAPALDAAMLREAAAQLEAHDAVFVPTCDGGYVLVGLRHPDRRWFADIAWSTSGVMEETRRRLRDAGARWAELAPLFDIDEPQDLVHVPAAWRAAVGPGNAIDCA